MIFFGAAYYLLSKKSKEVQASNTVALLMGTHPELTEESATIKSALGYMLQIFIEKYGNKFRQKHITDQLNYIEFIEQVAMRFDDHEFIREIQIRDTDLEVRLIELSKGSKSLMVGMLVNPPKGIVEELFWYIPPKGLEIKEKEMDEIVSISLIRSTRATKGFFLVKNGQLVPTIKDWGHKYMSQVNDPNRIKVLVNGTAQDFNKEDFMGVLRDSLYNKSEHVIMFGDSGSGKTSFLEGFIHAMTPITDPARHKLVLMTSTQFRDLMSGYDNMTWLLSEAEKDKAKYIICVDDLTPSMSVPQWEELISYMDGINQEQYGMSFFIVVASRNKGDFINALNGDMTAKSILRAGRTKYIIEFQTYNKSQWHKYVKELEKTLSHPYWYDQSKVKEVFEKDTPLSLVGSASFAEMMLGLTTEPKEDQNNDNGGKEPPEDKKRIVV